MTNATRQKKYVEREWSEKRERRNPKHPVATNWAIAEAVEDESFDIADVHMTEDDAARMGIAAASWMGVNR